MFYIFDCDGRIVGNPKGYRDIRQATKQQNMKGSKAYNAIWQAFWKACKENPYHERVSCINEGYGWNDGNIDAGVGVKSIANQLIPKGAK